MRNTSASPLTSGIGCIATRNGLHYYVAVPFATDVRIEELCARIRVLCTERLTPEGEVELRTLARKLRAAIQQHVQMAKSSLSAKKAAIDGRDLDME